MPFSPPITWLPGQVVAASDLNSNIRDNSLYLLAGRPTGFTQHVGSSDYSTASTTFVDVDATNLILSLTTNGSRVMVAALCMVSGTLAAGGCFLDFIVDSTTRVGGTNGLISTAIAGGGTQLHAVTAIGLFTGLAAGAHTFKLQYRGNGSGSATIYNTNIPVTLLAWEM
ncbi:MAG: hypothetical protein ACYDBJ_04510 [Aggregatilineales bacterium]